jgi:hypothetical protein
LQAFAQLNEGYKFKMDLITYGVVVTDAIKFVHTNKEKLISKEEENDKESKEPGSNEDKDQLGERQEELTQDKQTINQVF